MRRGTQHNSTPNKTLPMQPLSCNLMPIREALQLSKAKASMLLPLEHLLAAESSLCQRPVRLLCGQGVQRLAELTIDSTT